MAIYRIFELLLHPHHNNDSIDKIQNDFTVSVIINMALYFFNWINPINCWEKPYYHPSWLKYAEGICLVNGTKITSLTDPYPSNNDDFSKLKNVNFYHGIPLTLLIIGFVLNFPRAFWVFVTWCSYFNLTDYCNAAWCIHRLKPLKSKLAIFNKKFCDVSYRRPSKFRFYGFKHFFPTNEKEFYPKQLTICYFIYKILNLVSILISFMILNYFVAETTIDGFSLMKNLTTFQETNAFPRITVCLFEVRKPKYDDITDIQTNKIKCNLTRNYMYEKVYIVLWVWFITLFVLQSLTIISWIKKIIFSDRYIKDLIKSNLGVVRSDTLSIFVRHLPADLSLFIHILELNTDNILTSNILINLFLDYEERLISLNKVPLHLQD